MVKLPEDPKTPNPKKKKVVSEKRDPVTGYGISSRTSRIMTDRTPKRKLQNQNTSDILSSNKSKQMQRAADTRGIKNIGK